MAARGVAANCRKVVCIGRNYADHIKELNNPRPKHPFFFLKPSSSILEPNAGPVIRPRGTTLHYEVELALILGKRVKDFPENAGEGAALDTLAGYVVAIDMTARNVQDECKKKGLPWTTAKGFDTFLPISNFIGKDAIRDPHNVELWLDIDGESRQKDNSSLMLFRIPRLLSEVSRVMKLEPGDILCTGTPKGVGEVKAGQSMRAGLKVDGSEVSNAGIEVQVEDSKGSYIYEET